MFESNPVVAPEPFQVGSLCYNYIGLDTFGLDFGYLTTDPLAQYGILFSLYLNHSSRILEDARLEIVC